MSEVRQTTAVVINPFSASAVISQKGDVAAIVAYQASSSSHGGGGLRQVVAVIGTGFDLEIDVSHYLNTNAPIVIVRDVVTKEEVGCDVKPIPSSAVRLTFARPPALNSLEVVIYA